jgi:hypothetical protein
MAHIGKKLRFVMARLFKLAALSLARRSVAFGLISAASNTEARYPPTSGDHVHRPSLR